jgi:hypothetical protein
MKKYFLFFLNIIFLFQNTISQVISVNEKQLADGLKEKLMDEITSKITSSVESGEAWVADASYFSIVLEPFEPFGIDPKNPNFLNQAYELHKQIEEKIQKNPGLRYSGQLKGEIMGLVKNGMWNYAGSYIDNESKAIYGQVSGLISDGQKKITDLLDAASGISSLSPDLEDYESEVSSILKKFGIKSDYFFIIDDLDLVLSKGYEKIVDPLSALYIIGSAAGSDDPTYKIQMMLEFGEAFGGKVPIIGDLITPLFTLGKGVFDAAKGLENILEKNLNQGCISPAGGTYGSININKRSKFIKKFSQINRACPMNQKVYSPIYNNIFFNTSDNSELFFYLNNTWLRGKKDHLHKGTDDIYSSIQWLRKYNNAEKVTDLNFIFNSYQKEYGWSVYTEEVNKRISRFSVLLKAALETVGYCDDAKLEEFFLNKMGFNWITRLLGQRELEFGWNELKYFSSYWEKEIMNAMIYNYYLSKHQANLGNLDRIINFLNENVPVNIYGVVSNENGFSIQGAKLYVGYNSMFEKGDKCHKVISGNSGYFSYYILMPLDKKINTTVSASLPDGGTVIEDITIYPGEKRIYNVDLVSPYEIPDTNTTAIATGNNNADIDGNNDSTSVDNSDSTEIDITAMISNSDCAKDPNGVAEWDPVNKKVICTCVDNLIWDESLGKCVEDIQTILANSDCSKWPNTEAKWDYSTHEPYCDCIAGFQWNEDYTACISEQDMLVAQADCQQYPNTQAVWDPVNKEVICDCLPGFSWNEDYTMCISETQVAMQNMDCSTYPNTQSVWDAVSQEAYCDCLPGYEWNPDYTACEKEKEQEQIQYNCDHIPNSHPVFDKVLNEVVCNCLPGYEWNKAFTACVPVQRKPTVNWNDILNVTMGILNAANGNPQEGITPGAGAISNQQPVIHQTRCNDQQQQGGDAPEVHLIDLGQSFGSFVLDYDVYSVKDQIIVTQSGRTIYNSGCISGAKSIRLNLNGFSSQISVRVNPNCDGTSSTSWTFTVHCPDR